MNIKKLIEALSDSEILELKKALSIEDKSFKGLTPLSEWIKNRKMSTRLYSALKGYIYWETHNHESGNVTYVEDLDGPNEIKKFRNIGIKSAAEFMELRKLDKENEKTN